MTEFTAPRSLNHAAYVTWDTAATIAFYRDVMGMRLISYATAEEVPSTGAKNHFLHTFFEMKDRSCIAFFEIEGLPKEQIETVVPWARHIALSVDSEEELMSAMRHLKEHDVEVLGPVDHEGIWKSLYFFDPKRNPAGDHLSEPVRSQTRTRRRPTRTLPPGWPSTGLRSHESHAGIKPP